MHLKNSKIIVIKIGSALLVDSNKKIRNNWFSNFAKDIKKLKSKTIKEEPFPTTYICLNTFHTDSIYHGSIVL